MSVEICSCVSENAIRLPAFDVSLFVRELSGTKAAALKIVIKLHH